MSNQHRFQHALRSSHWSLAFAAVISLGLSVAIGVSIVQLTRPARIANSQELRSDTTDASHLSANRNERVLEPAELQEQEELGQDAASADTDDAETNASEQVDDKKVPMDPAELEKLREKFEEEHTAWKSVMKRMMEVELSYLTCSRSEVDGLVIQWEELQDEGKQHVQSLKKIGTQIYRSSPELEKRLANFLAAMVKEDVDHDRYKSAYDLTKMLLEQDLPASEFYRSAGFAAFAQHRFDEAQDWLGKAPPTQDKELAQKTELFKYASEMYKELWPKEQEARERDAELGNLPIVKLETSKGDIIVELFEDDAPLTVNNFVYLVESGFYDGLKFHRVLPNFMAQTGCPKGDGTGGPGYTIPGESSGEDIRRHFTGTLSMANTGDPNSGGSQFFITFLPTPVLDNLHAVFGRVIEGMEVLQDIKRIDPSQESSYAIEPDYIIKAEVIRKRDHEYRPTRNASQ